MANKWVTRAGQLLAMPQASLVRLILQAESQLPEEQIDQILSSQSQLDDPRKKKRSRKDMSEQNRFDFSKARWRRIALKICYIGKEYFGVAIQKSTPLTVQQKILEAMETCCLIPTLEVRQKMQDIPPEDPGRFQLDWTLCGRTDRGVNAFGNVVIVNVRTKLSEDELKTGAEDYDFCRLINNNLPKDIRVVGWAPANDLVTDVRSDQVRPINARFDCSSRLYKYLIFRDDLDLDAMRMAASFLVGEHDFRNFCKVDLSSTSNFVRKILRVSIEPFEARKEDGSSDSLYVIVVHGYAFLYHQIRCIVSLLLLVGRGLENPEIVKELLDIGRNPRKPEYEMADELPLILWDCEFPQLEFEISEQAKEKLLHEWQTHWRRLHMETTIWKYAIHKYSTEFSWKGAQNVMQLSYRQNKHTPLMSRNKGATLEEMMAKHNSKIASKELEDDGNE
jgi:tRNA pseudouridine38/39 synthase